MIHYKNKLINNAKKLRKKMTPYERKLWYDFFIKLPIKIYRQRTIGGYILDFYCSEKRIAIEIDGSQHYEVIDKEKDKKRTEYLKSLNITVFRYTNYEIFTNFEGVCEDLRRKLL